MTLVDSIRSLRRPKAVRRPDLAGQWQLMWWKFRRHRLAMVGLALLGLFLTFTLFAEAIGPYPPSERNPRYVAGAPMLPRFFEEDGTFHLRPFVYGHKTARDPVTLRLKHETDTTQIWKLSALRARQALPPARPDPDRHPPVRHRPRATSISSARISPASTSFRAPSTPPAPR